MFVSSSLSHNHEHSKKKKNQLPQWLMGRPGLTEGVHEEDLGGLADRKPDANLQRTEAVENPNAILGSINRTAESGRREAIILVCAGGSGHMQCYAPSCGLYFKRGTSKFKAVQKSMKRIGRWYLDSTEIRLTVLLQLARSECLLH